MIDNSSLHISQKVHEMRLAAHPFSQILRGEKTLEIRLFDEKRRALSVGDAIVFCERDTKKTVRARITALFRFSSFREAFSALSRSEMGFSEAEDANAMYRYYSPEEEAKWGVLVIQIALV